MHVPGCQFQFLPGNQQSPFADGRFRIDPLAIGRCQPGNERRRGRRTRKGPLRSNGDGRLLVPAPGKHHRRRSHKQQCGDDGEQQRVVSEETPALAANIAKKTEARACIGAGQPCGRRNGQFGHRRDVANLQLGQQSRHHDGRFQVTHVHSRNLGIVAQQSLEISHFERRSGHSGDWQ